METIRTEELTSRIDELIERVASDERIIISHEGRQVALVSFDDLAFLEGIDQELDKRDAAEVRSRLADPSQVPVIFAPAQSSQQPTGTT